MEGALFAFLAVPALAGAVIGFLLTDWRLAGATAAGGFALLFVLPFGGAFVFALPAIVGAAVGATALSPFLKFANTPTVWGRMTVAMLAALVAGGAILLVTFGGR